MECRYVGGVVNCGVGVRVALLQTKQNRLYDFSSSMVLSHQEAMDLQTEMVEQTFSLGKQAAKENIDLIVTTEAINYCGETKNLLSSWHSYIPLYPENELFQRFSSLAKTANAWLVAGVYNKRWATDGNIRCYNSAFVYSRSGLLVAIYDKIHLAGTENDRLTAGTKCITVDTDMGKMGVAVCYDMQFSDVCKTCQRLGASFLAVPTWGWEHGYGLHRIRETGLSLAIAMAVPYRTPIVWPRSPSELILGTGQVLTAAGQEKSEVLIGELP